MTQTVGGVVSAAPPTNPAAFGSGPTVQFITSGVGLTVFILFLPGGLAALLHRIGDAVTAARGPATGAARVTPPHRYPGSDATRSRRGGTEAPPRPAGLEVYDLVVAFGGLLAVNGVDLSIEPGSTVGILGPNGSGKTTLLDAVSGLLRPASGLVHLDGVDLIDYLPEDRAALGVVRSFQDCRLYPELTVEDTLMVAEDARRPLGVLSSTLRLPAARRAENDKRQTVDEVLDAFGLEPFRHRRIDQLSTGTRRVVDLASIVTARPRLLLLDEPTAGMGDQETYEITQLIRRLHRDGKLTIVLIEHDMRVVFHLADRITVLDQGKLLAEGTAQEIAVNEAVQAAYLGKAA